MTGSLALPIRRLRGDVRFVAPAPAGPAENATLSDVDCRGAAAVGNGVHRGGSTWDRIRMPTIGIEVDGLLDVGIEVDGLLDVGTVDADDV